MHIHRKCRSGDYECSNVEFSTKEGHIKISGIEKRKLSKNQVAQIKHLYKSGHSTRKIAAEYAISLAKIKELSTVHSIGPAY